MKNQRGVSMVAIMVGLATLVLIGGITYIAFSGDKSKTKQTASTNDSTYTSKAYGYSFDYPTGWKSVADIDGFGNSESSSRITTSPDLATSTDGGFHLTKGALVYVSTEATTAQDASEYYASNAFLGKYGKNKGDTTVADTDAINYTLVYESTNTVSTVLVNDGRLYRITLQYANATALENFRPDFDQVVQSFKFN